MCSTSSSCSGDETLTRKQWKCTDFMHFCQWWYCAINSRLCFCCNQSDHWVLCKIHAAYLQSAQVGAGEKNEPIKLWISWVTKCWFLLPVSRQSRTPLCLGYLKCLSIHSQLKLGTDQIPGLGRGVHSEWHMSKCTCVMYWSPNCPLSVGDRWSAYMAARWCEWSL